MQISLTGHHATTSERLRSHVDKKFAKLSRHFDHISNVHVILTKHHQSFRAEATLHASGKELFANADAHDPFSAVDALSDKLDRQVVKYKEKLSSHRTHDPDQEP